MRKETAVSYYGTQQKLADALGMTQGAMCSWNPERIPLARALQLEKITKGVLKADLTLYHGRRKQPQQ